MLRLKDLMNPNVVSVAPDLTLRELMEVFTEQEVSGAPVVSGGVVVGVISMTDVFQFQEDAPEITLQPGAAQDEGNGAPARKAGSTTEYFAETQEPSEIEAFEWMKATGGEDWSLLDEYTVADVMTRDVMSQASDTPVQAAARYMLEHQIHRVLVVDQGQVRGIVTTTDIVRAVADGALGG